MCDRYPNTKVNFILWDLRILCSFSLIPSTYGKFILILISSSLKRMSINLPYVKGASEKLRRTFKSHKIRSTFCNENTLRKVLFKPKIWVSARRQDNNKIFYGIDSSNGEAVYFSESKWSLKSRSDEHKRSVRNCDCKKKEIAKHCWVADHNFSWNQKKVIDRESRLIPWKIKETRHSLKKSNQLKNIFYILPQIWLPNLQ